MYLRLHHLSPTAHYSATTHYTHDSIPLTLNLILTVPTPNHEWVTPLLVTIT